MKRYSIFVVRSAGDGREVELCQVDSNPQVVCKALVGVKKLIQPSGFKFRKVAVAKYSQVRWQENL
jgi:hypothetical protein